MIFTPLKNPLLRQFLVIIALIGPAIATGQSAVRVKLLAVDADTVLLDSLSVVPSSLEVRYGDSTLVEASSYVLLPATARLVWINKPQADSVIVSYRTFSVLFTEELFHKDTAIIYRTPEQAENPFIHQPEISDNFFDFGGLNANGSFSRGVSFGNNQDMVLNSSFNLQLAGKLDNVDVTAAMTDANLPIQPEGNTQQIQEFDKIFIQFGFNEGRQTVSAGDLHLQRPESHFMSFNKKVSGLQAVSHAERPGGWRNQLGGTLAISRGQYARNSFEGIEGVQGPYRLKGNDGETYIIVLAATERVYVDGALMTRGSDRDYVMDYNIGEVTFTPNRLITKDSRIVVEFEYSTQHYLRSLIHAGETLGNDQWKFRFNLYGEYDAKNQPVLQTFDDSLGRAKLELLDSIGDRIEDALFPGHDSTGFDPNIPMYRQADTAVGTDTFTIFIFSTHPDSAVYRVSFSYVGEGQGNYRIQSSSLNGRIYEWIAPVSGQPQGAYEPVILLVTPKRRQMVTAGAEWSPTKGSFVSTEVAVSDNDVNTFSSKDDDADKGLAGRLAGQRTLEWKNDAGKPFAITAGGHYEFAGKQFKPLDQYRPVEFVRDWNLQTDSVLRDEHLATAQLTFVLPNANRLGYGLTGFVRSGSYRGITHRASATLRAYGFTFLTDSRLTSSQDEELSTYFLRPNVQIAKSFSSLGGLTLGWKYEGEDRQATDLVADTLRLSSARYNDHRLFIQTPDTAGVFFKAEVGERNDGTPLPGGQTAFGQASRARTVNFAGALQRNPLNRLAWNLTYRRLDILDTNLTAAMADESYLGRAEYNVHVKKGVIRSSTVYELGNGRELKREYTFLEVAPGQGNYVWHDNNEDSLKQIYEFEVASDIDLLQANYVRVLTPTTEYVNANMVTFSEALHIEPAQAWRRSTGFRGVIGRFSNSTYAQINRKVSEQAGFRSVNPFATEIADTLLVASSSIWRNTFYFNRTDPVFGAELNVQDNFNKQILTYGAEERHRKEQHVRVRLNLGRRLNTQLQITNGRQSSSTPAFNLRDYDFTIREIEPKVTIQEKSTLRVSVLYAYSVKRNSAEFNSELAIGHEFTTEMRLAKLSRSTVTGRLTYAAITFNGDPRSALGYAMLAGLQPGNNFVWNVTLERTLANSFQLGLSYDGRKSDDSPFVHVGSAQVRAVF